MLNEYLAKRNYYSVEIKQMCLIKPYLTHDAWLEIIFDTFVYNLNWRALKGLF